MPRNRAKEWLARILLLAFSITVTAVLFFFAGELYFRMKWGETRYQAIPEWYVADERLGWVLEPSDFTGVHIGSFRKYHVVINSLRFRGPQPEFEPAAGRPRITVVGDSHLFAMALDESDRVPERLGTMLGDGHEVVNISAPGYGTGQEFMFLSDLAEKGYQLGDRLVLVFCTNDLLDNSGLQYGSLQRSPRKPSFEVTEEGELVVTPPTRASIPGAPGASGNRFTAWLSDRLFYAFLRDRALALASRNPWMIAALGRVGVTANLDRTPAMITAWYSPGWEDRWKVTRDVLTYHASSELLDETELIVVYLPSAIQVEESLRMLTEDAASEDERFAAFVDDPDRPQRYLSELCADEGIDFIDATPGLRAAADREPMYFLREGHLNEAGSDELASQIHEWLAGRGSEGESE